MKIIVPAVRIDEYGYQRTITTTFIYGETPRTAESDRFLRRPVVYAKTVFDYDFRAAQRLIATGRLAVYSTAIVAIAPLFVVNLAAELLTLGTRLLADGVGAVVRFVGVRPAHSIRATIGGLVKEIVG